MKTMLGHKFCHITAIWLPNFTTKLLQATWPFCTSVPSFIKRRWWQCLLLMDVMRNILVNADKVLRIAWYMVNSSNTIKNKVLIFFVKEPPFLKVWFSLKQIIYPLWWWCSVTKSCLTLRSHGPQHPRLPCPSLCLRVCSSSCPLSQGCYLTISSSAALFFCLQSFLASGSFPMRWLFRSGSPSTWTFSFGISPFNEYPGLISFRIDWFDLLEVQGDLKVTMS